jgi:4a-hydroxytetrahydrobiopterin dehydratase
VARPLLTEAEIEAGLAGLAWERRGDRIAKDVRLPGFRAAIAYVEQVADVAEHLDHHPDITISYNRVGLSVTTHDSGGLTASDIALARAVDAIGGGNEG